MSYNPTMIDWNTATGHLPWGIQRTVHETLQAVADEQVKLVWGRDYHQGSPCLINAIAQMLTTGGGESIPMRYYGPLVGAFDRTNRILQEKGVNTDYYVSPLAADVLLRYFAPLKPVPEVPDDHPQETLAASMKESADAIEADLSEESLLYMDKFLGSVSG